MTINKFSIDEATRYIERIIDEVSNAVITDRSFLETVTAGLLARGHVLVEDVPGTGKTLTAIALADALGLEYNRIQFTPDLLPSDITGTDVFNDQTGEFSFQQGPIFANVILADEINRAPPKTQSALLEAMDEQQVTVGGDTYSLPEPFFVIATQNPVEQEGTFSLPEAQQDRFILKASIGYPSRDGELELINRRSNRQITTPEVDSVIDPEQVPTLRQTPEYISMRLNVREYLIDIARQTRNDDRVEVGVSPRGIQRFYEAARARAVISGRSYVTPDDVKTIASAVITHRLVLTSEATIRDVKPEAVTRSVLDAVEVPAAQGTN
ncbi:MoxR family ATPase [Haloquadratum walsbyi]|jgi:MoxR-like ATPases|uniref:MoxR-like ATPase n=1 Tax=Haloquadratum walsbyi J07HQW2 TaxID=1238425 RepID=U1NJK6_9EURY|nr:AAA family ATPase [Haloquadratum walsbyi]ERG97133.1 MAG: MoxR-like ATPase [Haloquadratum walsbyi J07HQW2]